ncbi:MAG: response regulator [Pedosphaera sp.]|nr:response regulator [Pedosphaera sp.]
MKTLLLVEDSEDDIFLMKRAFDRANFPCSVQIVDDGDKAIDYLSGSGIYADRFTYPLPALLLLDIKLPRRNGLEILQWIRSQPSLKGLPVVMLTNSNEPEDIDHAYALGANSYLVKPINYEQLEQTLPRLMEYWLTANVSPYSYT